MGICVEKLNSKPLFYYCLYHSGKTSHICIIEEWTCAIPKKNIVVYFIFFSVCSFNFRFWELWGFFSFKRSMLSFRSRMSIILTFWPVKHSSLSLFFWVCRSIKIFIKFDYFSLREKKWDRPPSSTLRSIALIFEI